MGKDTNKLYRVTLRGLNGWEAGVSYGVSYVVAKDPTEAYQKVRDYLDEKKYGFGYERELEKIELLAEAYDYAMCKTMLFL